MTNHIQHRATEDTELHRGNCLNCDTSATLSINFNVISMMNMISLVSNSLKVSNLTSQINLLFSKKTLHTHTHTHTHRQRRSLARARKILEVAGNEGRVTSYELQVTQKAEGRKQFSYSVTQLFSYLITEKIV